jgi:hypothetical protein
MAMSGHWTLSPPALRNTQQPYRVRLGPFGVHFGDQGLALLDAPVFAPVSILYHVDPPGVLWKCNARTASKVSALMAMRTMS